MEQETTLTVLRNQIGCIGVIQNNLGQIVICSAAHPAINVVPYLTGKDIGIRTLGFC